MAANGRALAVGYGKRFVNQICTARDPAERVAAVASLPSLSSRVHVSSYDKNVEELEEARVPDHVIDAAKSDKYWGPHPTTGVFGPADESGASVTGGGKAAATAPGSGPSALDQTVWFRPLEDVDKPSNA
ncbi:hypothetical protein B296_00047092 [Ensete ventricosum]|uniref:Uncharacterized protein n=1 Tax=Ensete ventricosum TaxID=4639 RepID=A0A426YT76_ENSVE|nr:hypothetical protein B296_00047092 [Ensete ventricosum]